QAPRREERRDRGQGRDRHDDPGPLDLQGDEGSDPPKDERLEPRRRRIGGAGLRSDHRKLATPPPGRAEPRAAQAPLGSFMFAPLNTAFGLSFTLAMSEVAILTAMADPSGRSSRQAARYWARTLLTRSNITLDVQGGGNVAWREPLIVMANHQS